MEMERGLGLEGGSYGDADIGDRRPDSGRCRWHVIEQGKILRAGTASTALQAGAAAITAIKDIEAERSSFHHGNPNTRSSALLFAWLP